MGKAIYYNEETPVPIVITLFAPRPKKKRRNGPTFMPGSIMWN